MRILKFSIHLHIAKLPIRRLEKNVELVNIVDEHKFFWHAPLILASLSYTFQSFVFVSAAVNNKVWDFYWRKTSKNFFNA